MTFGKLLQIIPGTTRISYSLIRKLENGNEFLVPSTTTFKSEAMHERALHNAQVTRIDVFNRTLMINLRMSDNLVDW